MARRNTPVIWFERKDYEAIKRLMPDEAYLGDTFEQWLEKANKEIEKFKTLGFTVRETVIDHEQFAAYCAATGQDRNIATLGAFAVYVDRNNYERGEGIIIGAPDQGGSCFHDILHFAIGDHCFAFNIRRGEG